MAHFVATLRLDAKIAHPAVAGKARAVVGDFETRHARGAAVAHCVAIPAGREVARHRRGVERVAVFAVGIVVMMMARAAIARGARMFAVTEDDRRVSLGNAAQRDCVRAFRDVACREGSERQRPQARSKHNNGESSHCLLPAGGSRVMPQAACWGMCPRSYQLSVAEFSFLPDRYASLGRQPNTIPAPRFGANFDAITQPIA